ncbi:MAG: hypothetical protein SFW64_00645 [Alphaproteobacteria bacterium]|nr:hypothetical protein [Alphaproteobacteria bacterium]
MSPLQIERDLLPKITDKMIAKRVSDALRHEHADIHSVIKQIERITGINALTASNWYKGRYAPKARHLLMLASYYPQVLYAVCEMMAAAPVWQDEIDAQVVKAMQQHLEQRWHGWKKSPPIGDRSVTIRVHVDRHYAGQMNQRQLWFLGQLQQGHAIHIEDLMAVWGIHERTAKRDVSGLLTAGLIIAARSGRTCRYQLS